MKDIQDRTYKFALRVIKLCRSIPKSDDGRILGKQLLRSGTSIAANVEEAEAATTKKTSYTRF
jgi:four helix bundle protein